MDNLLKETFKNAADSLSIYITEEQLNMFSTYSDLLLEWNEKVNLTAITQPKEIAVKHFADCIALLKFVDISDNTKIIDVGTGAGFPGLPLAIMLKDRKDVNVTLLDSLNKRLIFLEEVCSRLCLNNCNIVHLRAEDGGKDKKYREQYDFAVSRAVAPLNVLCEYCMSYVKTGGMFIAMKGPNISEETENSLTAIEKLGGKLKDTVAYNLYDNKRNIITIKKETATPAIYPRQSKKISKQPL